MKTGTPPQEPTLRASHEEKSTVKVLEKAFVILDELIASRKPIGVNEIAKRTSIKVATAFRLLKTMKAHGWVFQDADEKYLVGPKISFVTERTNFYVALKEVAYFVMRRLSDSEQQAMNLVVRDGHRFFILQQTRTDRIVDYVPPIGTDLPAYASASGKILLAGLKPSLLEELLDTTKFQALTTHTITDRNILMEQLSQIAKDGYALDEAESCDNGFCIAVPVKNPSGIVIAGLSFSGIIKNFDQDRLEYYRQILQEGARRISAALFKTEDEDALAE